MFRIVSFLLLAGITAGLIWALRSQLIQVAGTKQKLRQQGQSLSDAIRQIRSMPLPAILSIARKAFYFLAVLSFLVLAITGFLPVIISGSPISGLPLILHVTLAPLFAMSLAVLTVFRAYHHRFNRSDGQRLLQWIRREKSNELQANPNVWQKICFWLIVLLSVPVLISVILSMYPLFGTAGQEFLLHLHGYTALLMLIAVVGHTYLMFLTTQRS
jgi:cytochrome b subunit of formate dehydrogenase